MVRIGGCAGDNRRNQLKRWPAPGYANFDDMLTAAVEKAIQDAPADLKTWKYGVAVPCFNRSSAVWRGSSFTRNERARTNILYPAAVIQ